ncbi:MAG: FkbM family methyltransferase [Bryobacteraceae bacterium]|nr:FkbM family methyltransferase [Bryobacteraceae bacterium]
MTKNDKRFYAQYDEDRALAHIFARTERGTCLEVGANDGVHLSNTYHFEQLGWRCILVEPNSDCCDRIRKCRQATLFECAASATEGQAVLHVGYGSDDVYSSLEAEPHTNCREGYRPVVVPTRTLDSILEESGIETLDFVTIDVEGHECETLRGFTLDRWRPRLVLIEDGHDFTDFEAEHRMRQSGYFRFWRSGANDWYARNGARRAILLAQILSSRCFSWKGLLKGNLPRALMRKVVVTKRSLLGLIRSLFRASVLSG